jgi:hypothetical protein
VQYAYECPACGPIESGVPGDEVQCRCGRRAARRFHVAINRSSLRQSGRWDPVVGEYVANDREFRDLLKKGVERESENLNMDVKIETCDARDTDALADLHGWKDRAADLEPSS